MNASRLQRRLLKFAVHCGKLADRLPRTQLGMHICRQLIRSGTSPAPNYAEASAAESKKDFIHKLSICLKELRESNVWLELIIMAGLVNDDEISQLLDESEQLSKIIAQSIITAKDNLRVSGQKQR